jgi:hypothetical protein
MADADSDEVVQPSVARSGCLEERRDAEVIGAGLDIISLFKTRDDIGRAMTDAAIGHADQRVIDGLEHQPYVERGAAVAADVLPVEVTLENQAGKALALEDAARDYATTRRLAPGVAPMICSGRTSSRITNSGVARNSRSASGRLS